MTNQPVPITVADVTMTGALIRTLLALNNAHAIELSWLEAERLRHLVAEAFLATRIGEVDALLLAFDQSADYDSPNFLWFRSRFPRFVYVDRVVVAPEDRGHGHARRLYRDLFALARQAGHDRIVCEVNSKPPNPASDAFHAALGFEEVGTGGIRGGSKTVRYLMHRLASPDP
jgi:predicted GNAT superfamily acetyltransferase